MRAPAGKAIYARRPDWYPDGNPAGYAKALGCNFIALHHFASQQVHLDQAAALGLPVFLWSHPDSWTPDSWLQTLESMAARVYDHNLAGFIADPEYGWQGRSRQHFADYMASAAASLPSVGLTSYPSWYIREFEAAAAAGMWGSPQLYGIIDPGSPVELHQRADRWRRIFGSKQLLPSLAAWVRTPIGTGATAEGLVAPTDQASYLAAFRRERGALLWQTATSQGADGRIRPWPGTEGFEILRRWQPGGALGEELLTRFTRKVLQPYPWPARLG